MDETMNNDVTCTVCYNTIDDKDKCITNCNHIYCNGCLNEWFDRGNVECPMCRVPVKSYLNESTNHKIVVLKHQPQNMVLIQTNTGYEDIIKNYRKKFNMFKIYLFVNTSYILYLQYRNYTLYNNCHH
jgi:hypothetical protein